MAEAKNEPRTLSAPDPCPHITRIEVIAANIHRDAAELDRIHDHLEICEDRS
jgi:hypothetical protein